eukprot:1160705-Pelagomonas_calceolata.AAC.19
MLHSLHPFPPALYPHISHVSCRINRNTEGTKRGKGDGNEGSAGGGAEPERVSCCCRSNWVLSSSSVHPPLWPGSERASPAAGTKGGGAGLLVCAPSALARHGDAPSSVRSYVTNFESAHATEAN